MIILMAMDTDEDFRAIAKKLHTQFAHPKPDKLIKLLKDGGHGHKYLIKEVKEVSDRCSTCIKRQKPPLRPVVSMPMAKKFNDILAVDLKQCGRYYFLMIADLATRFCQGTVINNKLPATIIRGLFKCWITIFGAPRKLLSDNGCEFNNEEVRTLGGHFNMKILTTPAESPWSNGVCERLNADIAERVAKIASDTRCDLETALAWAISARNAISNHSGFSPNQLVFGYNPAIPDVFNSEPPALEPAIPSEIVRKNLEALHRARRDFVKFESDEKYKRALRSKVRPTRSDQLEIGDHVLYKRKSHEEWRGPGIIIGVDGKQFIIKHGGYIVRVHAARLVGAPIAIGDDDIPVERLEDNREGVDGQSDLESSVRGATAIEMRDETPINDDRVECDGQTGEDQTEEITTVEPGASGIEGDGNGSVQEEINSRTTHRRSLNEKTWKQGERFSGVDQFTGEYVTGKVIDRAGKVKGRNKNLYNIERDNGWRGWYDFKSLKDMSEIPDEREIPVFFNSDAVEQAKDAEMQNWKDNDVFEEVEDTGQGTISMRWVPTEKIVDGKTILKTRLVVRGFEEDTENLRKDSPTCTKESVRLLLAMASIRSWECHTVDVKAAYLQGDGIKRDVYLKPPKEYFNGKLWKLKKTVYGLCDAARAWYNRVKSELTSLSVVRCSLDKGLFMWYRKGQLEGMMAIYVDDFLWAGTSSFEKCVIRELRAKFLIGNSASKSFKYVGLNIMSTREGITVDQLQYASSLQPITVSRARAANKTSELSESEREECRGLAGQLHWLTANTRPDLAYDTCEHSGSLKNATIADLQKLNKLVERVTKDCVKLCFPRMEAVESCHLECFTDAAFMNLKDYGSQGGTIILLKDSSGQRCPLFWRSRKIARVVKSTLAAETLALVEGAETASYIASIIKEVTKMEHIPIHCYVDNKSLVDALHSDKNSLNHGIKKEMAVMEDMLNRKEVNSVSWIHTSQQLADCLTKRGASTEKLREAIFTEVY